MKVVLGGITALAASLLMIGTAMSQVATQELLNQISNGSSAAAAEKELVRRGAEDPSVKQMLSNALPSLLAPTKNLPATWLLAELAGGLKLLSTIPALCDLLQKNTKSMVSDLYEASNLLDDPVGLALVQIGPPSIPEVSKVLRSPDFETRLRAVRVLGKIGTPEARGAIANASQTEDDPRMRAFMLRMAKAKPATP